MWEKLSQKKSMGAKFYAAKIFAALIKCFLVLIDPMFWYVFFGLFIASLLIYGILNAVQYIGGTFAHILDKVVGFFNKKAHRKLHSVGVLVDGSCNNYNKFSVILKYFIIKLTGKHFDCKKMASYDKASLGRIFIVYPMRLFHIDCVDLQQMNICAAVIGGKTLAHFMFTKGIWIYFWISLLSPLISCLVSLAIHVIRGIWKRCLSSIHRLHPRRKKKKLL